MTGDLVTTGTRRFVLDVDRVEVGDVILTSQRKIRSKGIRFVTRSDYSHAMICVGHASYIHAVGSGVEVANPQREDFDRADRVCVLRYAGNDRNIVAGNAASFARTQVGMEYSVPDVFATKIHVLRRSLSNRQFCSRLVAQAYANAGISLVNDPEFCSPRDLFDSRLLIAVPDCVREANAIDRHLIDEDDGKVRPLVAQANMIKIHLKEARAITRLDLQTPGQIYSHLMLDNTHDLALSRSLENSGYLSLWQVDMSKNPWRYDAAKLISMGIPVADLSEIAEREVTLSESAIERFEQNATAILHLLGQVERQYFRLEYALYAHLVKLHQKRLREAKIVLAYVKENGFPDQTLPGASEERNGHA